MNWHKEKKFKCPYCKRSFKKKRQLTSHIQDTHDTDRNTGIICPNCSDVELKYNSLMDWGCPKCGYIEEVR